MADPSYIGRFAPSPTGPLHFGSLLAALASYLDARAEGGQWLLRIDDIDPLREQAGASDAIQRTLEHFGLTWDGSTHFQSRHLERFRDLCDQLQQAHQAYPCNCSRKKLAAYGGRYPGFCRQGPSGSGDFAIRVWCDHNPVEFTDRIQGHQHYDLAQDPGDYIIWRRDNLVAYQLAAAADDAWQEVNQVVRGVDLIDSTPRQLHLQALLGFPPATYAHIPVVVNDNGQKLSKQNLARPLPEDDPRPALVAALELLGQHPPSELRESALDDLLGWGIAHWSLAQVPRRIALSASTLELPFDV
ncbi:tRNA glutamyl-Q(34) synthetase GluQRS [Aestuariirhabdus litorea]|uniref:Glutamyl-Q tRNA(Asp) synthetase n=1 Tax=Aestuariirhabdus litorea TaxID=2528527 RepID=A0A3P3VIR5_9GAMM|nr:tRNA glutamyl-Q(34) synthetase GluQRS [Aestuariirhabdus litorea]RRJ82247.1 tRNA glutamyl-Q(34) synthetase GluQRS [Aestuariirhabdus litorea]RWW92415.1 tRNA glutamyl-Q(34) synthetase GluQRS [Endozoicomonadaceae bacterium GTF-13]